MNDSLKKYEVDFLIENINSYEAKTIIARSVSHRYKVINLAMFFAGTLEDHIQELKEGKLVPIGSKQFINSIFTKLDLKSPKDLNYVPRLDWAYNRQDVLDSKGDLLVTNSLNTAQKWRYYVLNNKVVGKVELNQKNSQRALNPTDKFVSSCLECFSDTHLAPCAFAIDIAVVDDGIGLRDPNQTEILFQIHDAWALSLHPGLENKDLYLEMLIARWQEIRKEQVCYA